MENLSTNFLICIALLFLMQAGFMLYESGTIRAKNSYNTAMKNIADLILGLFIYLVSYELIVQFLDSSSNEIEKYANAIIKGCFCISCITICSGAVAERLKYSPYLVLVIFSAGISYPIIEFFLWTSQGFILQLGYFDRAGAGVVHLAGGIISLVASVLVGPRSEKHPLNRMNLNTKFIPSNVTLLCLGSLLLLVGWFGFNVISIKPNDPGVIQAILITMMGAIGGGMAGVLFSYSPQTKSYSIDKPIKGLISGLVSVTGAFPLLSFWGALVVGVLGYCAAQILDKALEKFKVDDPVGAISVHAGGGLFGLLVPLLFKPEIILAQTLGIILITGVSVCITYLALSIYSKWIGPLRPSREAEASGLNISEHNCPSLADELSQTILNHVSKGSVEKYARVEPFTQIGVIANRYNILVKTLEKNFQDQLARMQKSFSNEFELSAFAHDLRTPLNVLRAEAFLLTDSKQNKSIDPIKSSKIIEDVCISIDKMIDHVLDKKRTSKSLPTQLTCHWNEIIAKLKTYFKNQFENENIRFTHTADTCSDSLGLSLVVAVRIFSNLIQNSIESIQTVPMNDNREISLTIMEKGDVYECELSDSGAGIEEDKLSFLFSAYHTTKVRGHGIGLAVCKSLLEEVGGAIILKSSYPTCFKITIPKNIMKGERYA